MEDQGGFNAAVGQEDVAAELRQVMAIFGHVEPPLRILVHRSLNRLGLTQLSNCKVL